MASQVATRLSFGAPRQLTSSSGMYSSWQQQSVQNTPPQYRQCVRPLLVMSRKLPSKRFGHSGHSDTSSSWTHLLLGVRASRAAAMLRPTGSKSVVLSVMISCSSVVVSRGFHVFFTGFISCAEQRGHSLKRQRPKVKSKTETFRVTENNENQGRPPHPHPPPLLSLICLFL